MQKRLTALDGLRGFAALAVVISHLGFNLWSFTSWPIAHYIYRTLSAGTYSVQAFFVLSGFLMAFLYPTIKSSFQFLGKRYLRIMPVFGAVVMYIYWHELNPYLPILNDLMALLAIAVSLHVLWLIIEKLNERWRWLGKLIFIAFLLFQTAMLVFSLTALPALLAGPAAPLNELRKLLIMLANLSMTMYLQNPAIVSNGVFWSLVPEMLFYLVYPFVVVPLIQLGNKMGSWFSLLMTAVVFKIIFDLDTATMALYALHGIFVSRASGFVIGIWVGTLYRNKGKLWQQLEKVLRNPWLNVLILGLFFFLLAFEWPDRFHQIRDYVRLWYLALSLGFGLVIAAAVSEGSLIGKVFSHKILVFLGMISYSLYLIHPEVMERISNSTFLWQIKQWLPVENLFNVVTALIKTVASVAVAWILFTLIEKLYFAAKQKKMVTFAVTGKQAKKKPPVFKPSPWQVGLVALASGVVLTAVYAGGYAPSLIMAKQPLPKPALLQELLVTAEQSQRFEFTAKEPNLSVVFFTLDYAREPANLRTEITQEVQLIFKLYDENQQLLFESRRQPQEVEGAPHFPFGWPTIPDSAGKKYFVELNLIDTDPSDQIYIHSDAGLVTQYTTAKNISFNYLYKLVTARLAFAFSHSQLIFALLFIAITSYSTIKLTRN